MPQLTHPALQCDVFLQAHLKLVNAGILGVLRKQKEERGGPWHVVVDDPKVKLAFVGAPEVSTISSNRLSVTLPRVDFDAELPIEAPIVTRVIKTRGSVAGVVEVTLRLSSAGSRLEIEAEDIVLESFEIQELSFGEEETSGLITQARDIIAAQLPRLVKRLTGGRLPLPIDSQKLLDTALTDQPIDPSTLRIRLTPNYLLAWGLSSGITPEVLEPIESERDLLLHLSETIIAEPVQSSVNESLKEREDSIFSERYALTVKHMKSELVQGGLSLKGMAILEGKRPEGAPVSDDVYYPDIRAEVHQYLYEYQGIDSKKNEVVLLNTKTDYDLNKDDLKAFVIAGLKSSGRTWGADRKWRYFPPIGIIIGIALLIFDIKAFGKNSQPDTFTYNPEIEDQMVGVGVPLKGLDITPGGVTLKADMNLSQSPTGPHPLQDTSPPIPGPADRLAS